MSNLTDFFSAGGAGGGIGQTITVGDISYPNARSTDDCRIYKYYNSSATAGHGFRLQFSGPNSNHPSVYYNANSKQTWVTMVDITSSTNGGAFFGVANFAAFDQNQQEQFKITIDGGTPITYNAYSVQHYQRCLTVLGPIGILKQITPTDSDRGRTVGNAFEYSMNGGATAGLGVNNFAYDATSNSYYAANNYFYGYTPYIMANPDACIAYGAPYIYFSSTLKVEVQTGETAGASATWAIAHLF